MPSFGRRCSCNSNVDTHNDDYGDGDDDDGDGDGDGEARYLGEGSAHKGVKERLKIFHSHTVVGSNKGMSSELL